ncbi:metalloregulator ArsR/SmtB family transcription factor [Granulosicoccaceae sp. 1_MG-2023]|nr:metalloregulator ArsR/SmtB family transcription factor [Granulosicoccaceae sp. 1_MG-2023]
MLSKDELLSALRAVGEPTRLRLMALCARGELSVSELTRILGQSQPRVSRHLKMLVDAGMLERFREGALVFYRLNERGDAGALAEYLSALLPEEDEELARDRSRLDQVRRQRAEAALRYFSENADQWNEIRSLHVPEREVEEALLEIVGDEPVGDFLDVGTGTGRMLVLLADRIAHGLGLDINTEMLNVARDTIARAGLSHVHVRKGDMYSLPLEDASVDLATLHLVLHYSAEADRVVAEAARVLRPGARLIIIDFAPHHEEYLRHEHQHFRLGFSDAEIHQLFTAAGLRPGRVVTLDGDPLTVTIWVAEKPGVS